MTDEKKKGPAAPNSTSDLTKMKKIWEYKPVEYLDMSRPDDRDAYARLKNLHQKEKIKIDWEEKKWVASPLETTFYICLLYAEPRWVEDDSDKDGPFGSESGEVSGALGEFRSRIQTEINEQVRASVENDVDGNMDFDDIELSGFTVPNAKSPLFDKNGDSEE